MDTIRLSQRERSRRSFHSHFLGVPGRPRGIQQEVAWKIPSASMTLVSNLVSVNQLTEL